MGAMSGLMGTAGGVNGTGISGPQQATIQQGTSAQDVQNAQKSTGNTLADQHALLAALQNQNGLGRQTDVASQQQALANQMSAANGVGTQNQAISGLQGTAGMYQNIASGQGPNPAMAALNQATGQNVANQAALMAGQRGAGANAGLLARQAAQQGANTQQQAVGQGATMQAQQQINALSGLTNAQQAAGSLGSTQVGQQQGQQAAQANMANQIAGQQIAQVNNNAAGAMQNQQSMQNALAGINSSKVSSMGSVNAANAGLANTNMQGQQAMIGQGMGAVGTAGGLLAEGGQVRKMADGGLPDQEPSQPIQAPAAQTAIQGPQSGIGQVLNNQANPQQPQQERANLSPGQQGYGTQQLSAGAGKFFSGLGHAIKSGFGAMGGGGGEQMAGPDSGGGDDSALGGVMKMAPMIAAMAADGGLAQGGGHVNAKNQKQKALQPGNNYENDKIPAKLSEGEIVLPRSVTMSSDPVSAAADFVKKTLNKKNSPQKSYFEDGGEAVSEDASNQTPEEADPQTAQAETPSDDQAQEAPPAPNAAALNKPEPPPLTPIPNYEQSAPPTPKPIPNYENKNNNPAPVEISQNNSPQPSTSNQLAPLNEDRDQLHAENVKTWQDLTNGHIKAETYKDLFNKKSTLGKIGTIFGMILSGAGAGLAHGQNQLMQMMNNEISNDLESQKSSSTNAQNLLKLNQQNELNKADIGLTGEQARIAAADANAKAFALTRTQLNMFALHDLVMNAQKLPPGSPARQAADQTLAMMSNAVQNENYNIVDRAYAASQLTHAAFGAGGDNSEAAFQASQRGLRVGGNDKLADDNESRHIPGVAGLSSIPLTQEDRGQALQAQALIASLKRLKDFSKQNPRPIKGSPADKMGRALAAQVQGDFRLATKGGVYKEGEQNFINQVVPGDPTSWNPFAHVIDKIDTVINETGARNNQFLKSKGFPIQSSPKRSVASGGSPKQTPVSGAKHKEGDKLSSKSGKPMTYTNGRWIYDATPSSSIGTNNSGPKY